MSLYGAVFYARGWSPWTPLFLGRDADGEEPQTREIAARVPSQFAQVPADRVTRKIEIRKIAARESVTLLCAGMQPENTCNSRLRLSLGVLSSASADEACRVKPESYWTQF